jgi:hypothetical protein
MANKYRAKPVMIEAIEFIDERDLHKMITDWGEEFGELVNYDDDDNTFTIDHESGVLNVKPGQWVIRGDKKGDFYNCDGDVFMRKYELAVQ